MSALLLLNKQKMKEQTSLFDICWPSLRPRVFLITIFSKTDDDIGVEEAFEKLAMNE